MATLLLIDDDIEVLKLNQKYLTQEGFTVYISSDPKKGIAGAKKVNPDCILLDVMMPGMDGFQVCQEIRSSLPPPLFFLPERIRRMIKLMV